MKKIISIVFFILIFAKLGISQNLKNENLVLRPMFHYGFVYPHYEGFKYFIDKKPYSFELDFGIRTSGKYYWQQVYRYPTIGIGLFYVNLGNPKVLGNGYSIYWFYNKKILDKKIFLMNTNVQIGTGYLNKVFDPTTNYLNYAVTTHFNVYFSISLEAGAKINNKLYFFTAFGISHFSNGSTNKPNLGINYINLRAGLNYALNQTKPNIVYEKKTFTKNNNLFITFSSGFIGSRKYSDFKKYLISNLTANYNKVVTQRISLGVAFDLVYNSSLSVEFKNLPNITAKNYLMYGSRLVYERKYGRTCTVISLGVNYNQKLIDKYGHYQRYGIRYNLTKHLYFSALLQTHYAIADWMLWGFGYKF